MIDHGARLGKKKKQFSTELVGLSIKENTIFSACKKICAVRMRNAFNVITFHVSITAGKKCLLFLLNAVKSGTTLV